MHIWVDADACPVVIKDILFRAAERTGRPLTEQRMAGRPGWAEYAARKSWRRFWLVDPLDGTKEFVKRNGEFTVNIALIEDGAPVFGVVYAPGADALYAGGPGRGALRQVGEAPAEPHGGSGMGCGSAGALPSRYCRQRNEESRRTTHSYEEQGRSAGYATEIALPKALKKLEG